jgi:hypothetical protein
MNEIKFSDLARELGLSNLELSRLRDDKLTPAEHFSLDGKKWFTHEGAEKLRLASEVPLAVPDKAVGRVIRPAVNQRWVYVELQSNRGVVVPVAIPRRLYGRLINKTINVDIIKDASGGISYRHEDLGRK